MSTVLHLGALVNYRCFFDPDGETITGIKRQKIRIDGLEPKMKRFYSSKNKVGGGM